MMRTTANRPDTAYASGASEQISSTKRILEFEGMRGILAWWIVIGHFLQRSGYHTISTLPAHTGWIIRGRYAVDVFIILSGFVIFLLLDNKRYKNYFQFISERFFRLFPVYIISFIIAILLQPLNIFTTQQANWHEPEYAARILERAQQSYDYFLPHLMAHLSMLHGAIPNQVLPNSNTAFLVPAWAVSLEWQFYLIAPFLIWMVRRSLSLAILVFGLLLLSERLFADWSFGNESFLPLKFELFTIGIVSYYLYRFIKNHPQKVFRPFPGVALLAILGSVSLRWLDGELSQLCLPLTIWSIVFSAAIAQTLPVNQKMLQKLSNWLSHPVLQELGKISYSTYLIHFPIMWVVMWLALTINPDITGNTVLLFLVTAGSTLTLLLSFALFHWVEKPFAQLGKQICQKLAKVEN